MALASKVASPQIAYTIKLMSINHDDALSYAQKAQGYQVLTNEFPGHKAELESCRKVSQEMADAGFY